jgi:hypothetical protein
MAITLKKFNSLTKLNQKLEAIYALLLEIKGESIEDEEKPKPKTK